MSEMESEWLAELKRQHKRALELEQAFVDKLIRKTVSQNQLPA